MDNGRCPKCKGRKHTDDGDCNCLDLICKGLKERCQTAEAELVRLNEALDSLEMEFDGVMFLGIDKWLEGKDLKLDRTQRAAKAREVALKAIEAAIR